MIMKEWRCAAHGPFDAVEQLCPYGCSARFVVREIRTAPAIRSAGTRNTDTVNRQLAQDFNLPDLSNANGDSVMTNLRKKDWKKFQGVAPSVWAGGVPHAAPGWTQREGERPPTFDPQSAGMARGAQLAAGTVPPVKPMIMKDNKGRPLSYNAPLPDGD